ncbi:PEP-CTERM sorting domain-containing protein [Nitrococcus mobilis]|uniref:Ice-binding protein C-terminal domain-containing protein n=1 Tax=Nitrococcus mobilis Nb-231 TaxID=314278 RepID=A4BTM2_9GAMM|nr:PEP-CTERM sorting domain-containing protein [Nitrococcus mobilis]EAR20978.1 hypothetical protein NB231_00295 [Nitrococcus mobilis Nb-231]
MKVKIIYKLAGIAQGLPGLMALFTLGLAASLFTPGGQANATPIGPTCNGTVGDENQGGSCQGATYTLTFDGNALPDSDPNHETYRITYTIDTTNYASSGPNPGVAIDAAAIKVSSKVSAASLFDAPQADGSAGGATSWALIAGGINANGCSGAGGGFECADWTASGNGAAVGGILSWIFDITVDNGDLFAVDSCTTNSCPSIKARYVDASGNKTGDLVSEPITLQIEDPRPPTSIPEPATLLLLGCGLLGLALLRRRLEN